MELHEREFFIGRLCLPYSKISVAENVDVFVHPLSVEALVIYKDTGNTATSNLIAYIDTGTGLPFTTNGADVDIVFDSGSNKIFAL